MKREELHQFIRSTFKDCHPEKIILFGSWARGEEDPYSDVDLIIVLKSQKRFLDRLADLYDMWSLPLPVDILAYTPEEYSKMIEEQNLFITFAIKEGVTIYEKSSS